MAIEKSVLPKLARELNRSHAMDELMSGKINVFEFVRVMVTGMYD